MSENFRKPEAYKSLNASSATSSSPSSPSFPSLTEQNEDSIFDKSVMFYDFIQSFKNLFTLS